MFLKRFFNLEFGAISLGILFFYLSNYMNSFMLMGLSESAVISRYLAYAALAGSLIFCLLSIWKNRSQFFARSNSYKLLAVLAISVVLVLATKNIGMLLSLPIGVMLVNTKDKDIFRYVLCSSVVLYAFTVLLYLFGVVTGGDKVDTALFDNKENVKQLISLGFSNPNLAYKFFMPILLSALYLYSDRKAVIIVLLITSTILGLLTGSTAGLIIAVIACIAFSGINRRMTKEAIKKIAPYGFIFLTILSFAIATSFGSPGSLPNPVNDALSGRPQLWSLRVEDGSFVNLFGNNDQYTTSQLSENGQAQQYYALDNTYLYLMVHYGLVIYLLYLWLYVKSTKLINDERILLVGLILLLAMVIGERADFISNIFLLFAIKYVSAYYFNIKDKYRDE
jgi:hypothetical protein